MSLDLTSSRGYSAKKKVDFVNGTKIEIQRGHCPSSTPLVMSVDHCTQFSTAQPQSESLPAKLNAVYHILVKLSYILQPLHTILFSTANINASIIAC